MSSMLTDIAVVAELIAEAEEKEHDSALFDGYSFPVDPNLLAFLHARSVTEGCCFVAKSEVQRNNDLALASDGDFAAPPALHEFADRIDPSTMVRCWASCQGYQKIRLDTLLIAVQH